ncbi:Uma2 family endonuclease [Tundrisphaera lichenicola]|uniref:Uma2 family endonuclease n=1 Tax=Tundrisphaera lichenicola TaxID=2029860 RepID=UPI003EC057AC
MSTVLAPPDKKLATVEEFLAIPEDGISRELIRGEIREFGMTLRNNKHSGVEANIVQMLKNWLDGLPRPRGKIHSGECGFRLRGTVDSLVGIDVAYASADLVARTDQALSYYEGPPVLAVEILSPSDRHENVVEKIGLYLEAGVVVWEVDPDFRTVRVHRPGQLPESFNASQELSGDPYVPGFRIPVVKLFED